MRKNAGTRWRARLKAAWPGVVTAAMVVCAIAISVAVAPQPAQQDGVNRTSAPAAPVAVLAGHDEGSAAASGSSSGGEGKESPSGGAPYDVESVLVTLAEGVSARDLSANLSADSALAGVSVEKEGEGYVKLALPAGLAVDDALALLKASGSVASAQPNYRYRPVEGTGAGNPAAASTPSTVSAASSPLVMSALTPSAITSMNDRYYRKQWGLTSVNALTAWNLVSGNIGTSSAVTVAVIDEGFIVKHEDLAAHVVDYYNLGEGKRSVGTDYADHGTHVAGIVSAVANNGKGIAGMANNSCGLMLLRVADEDDEITTDTIVDAYTYLIKRAKTHNVRVVNMSLGADTARPVSRSTDPAFYDAIAKARSAGIVTVVAASNADTYNPPFYSFPADFDNVVSVINLARSTNSDGVERDSSSNYNVAGQKTKNISAPGTSIVSLGDTRTSYETETGTSMASPLVAGVFALMFDVNPSLTPAQATSKLYSSAKDLTASSGTSAGWDRETGYGEVDAAAAVCSVGATSTTTSASKTCIADLTISASNKTFTGKALTPAVKVVNGSTTLVNGVDYTVSYRDNVNVGKAAFTVVGKGSYCGIAVGTFTIEKVKPAATKLKKLTPGAKKIKVKWKKQTTRTTGYQVQVATNAKFTKGKKTVTVRKNRTTVKTVKKLKADRKYYVRVRTYKTVAGKTFYSSWSKALTTRTR